MRTREDRKRIQDLADLYGSQEHSHEQNIKFALSVIRDFPFSCFAILRGRRFKSLWDDVVKRTAFLDGIYSEKDISRLYYYVNRLAEVIVCSADDCTEKYTKKITPKQFSRTRFYCNATCAQRDSSVKSQIKQTKEANHTTTKDLLQQTRKRNKEMFGCDWYFQSEEFKQKKLETWQSNGYDHPMHSDDIKQEMSDRYFAEHGVRHAFQNPDVQDKIHQTNLENLGVEMPMQSDDFRKEAHAKSTESKVRAYYRDVILKFQDIEPLFSEDEYAECRDGAELKWKCKKCGDVFMQKFRHTEPRCYKCKPLIYDDCTSNLEKEVFEFVKSVASGYDCFFGQEENWSVLSLQKQQLDIVCKSKATRKVEIAFEVNGIYWHQICFKPHNYHLNKTKACERLGIKLVHIWEDEWMMQRDSTEKLIRDVISGKVELLSNSDTIEVPRDKFSKCFSIPGFHLVAESECNVVSRSIGDKVYEVEDCGTFTYQRDS